MCIFSGRVEHVGGTKIFARLKADVTEGGSQYLVYSMSVNTEHDVAMILPLPVSNHAEDAVKFIALDAYPEFFDDMEKGFPHSGKGAYPEGCRAAEGPPRRVLEVHEVGDFSASFVPTLGDFNRLDARFRLPKETWNELPQYRDWGFAVFQLRASSSHSGKAHVRSRRIHPMAFLFPTRLGESLYFPTLHIHDGQVKNHAVFDHALFFQGEAFEEFADEISTDNAMTFVKVDKAKGIVQQDAACGKRTVVGRHPSRDVVATRPS
jgi:hypothetical protein